MKCLNIKEWMISVDRNKMKKTQDTLTLTNLHNADENSRIKWENANHWMEITTNYSKAFW